MLTLAHVYTLLSLSVTLVEIEEVNSKAINVDKSFAILRTCHPLRSRWLLDEPTEPTAVVEPSIFEKPVMAVN